MQTGTSIPVAMAAPEGGAACAWAAQTTPTEPQRRDARRFPPAPGRALVPLSRPSRLLRPSRTAEQDALGAWPRRPPPASARRGGENGTAAATPTRGHSASDAFRSETTRTLWLQAALVAQLLAPSSRATPPRHARAGPDRWTKSTSRPRHSCRPRASQIHLRRPLRRTSRMRDPRARTEPAAPRVELEPRTPRAQGRAPLPFSRAVPARARARWHRSGCRPLRIRRLSRGGLARVRPV